MYVPQADGTVKRKFAYGKDFDECDRKRSYETYEQGVRNHLRGRLGSKVMVKLGVPEIRGLMQRLAEEKGTETPLGRLFGSSKRRSPAAMVEDIGPTQNVAKLVHIRATTDSGAVHRASAVDPDAYGHAA
ncbi:hypothetical protein AB0D59_50385 [Streptomyces sp. NPDC048417]|uniref:hypothetical protein n=1 Tax=Streptomyces sp. NPDC048417 TaxID=3155387 RepID=UPI00341CEE7E